MTAPRRIPLNACDNCIHGHHRLLTREQRGENIAYMMIDLAGRLDPAVVQSELSSTMLAHPVTMSSLRTTLWRMRPFWKVPPASSQSADRAARQAYCYEDLRGSDDGLARLDEYRPDWESSDGPQVRLEHYDLPGERTRLILRWPHYFMDAEGAQSFLAQLEHHRQSPSRPDVAPVSVLTNTSLLERLRWIAGGWSNQKTGAHSKARPLPLPDQNRFDAYHMLHRCWRGEDFERLRGIAKQAAPAGPALYGRHLAAAVVRALDRVYRDERVETDVYDLTFPMRVRRPGRPDEASFQRPIFGNYLVTPTLRIRRETVADPAALGEEIFRQLNQFLDRRGDAAQWALLEAASCIHPWLYPLIFKLSLAAGSYSTGFSYYAEIDAPLRSFAGVPVTNLWGGGPITTPPGWNPVFSRYGGALNLCLTWTRPAITDDLARRYASHIEEFMFAET